MVNGRCRCRCQRCTHIIALPAPVTSHLQAHIMIIFNNMRYINDLCQRSGPRHSFYEGFYAPISSPIAPAPAVRSPKCIACTELGQQSHAAPPGPVHHHLCVSMRARACTACTTRRRACRGTRPSKDGVSLPYTSCLSAANMHNRCWVGRA